MSEAVPRASMCTILSTPTKPAPLVSVPLDIEQCPGKVVLLPMHLPLCVANASLYSDKIKRKSFRAMGSTVLLASGYPPNLS